MKNFLFTGLFAVISALSVCAAEIEESNEVMQEIKVEDLEKGVSPATVDYIPTSTFSIRIPKTITLDENGYGNYTVGVKGKIPDNTVVKIKPSNNSIQMESVTEDGSNTCTIEAQVTPGKVFWNHTEVNKREWSEDSTSEIQMEEVALDRLKGFLSFDISFLQSNTYSISYDLDGGENGNNPDSWTELEGSIKLEPAVKSDYDFAGWWNGKQMVSELSSLSEDIVLTARWATVGSAEELNGWEYVLDKVGHSVILSKYLGSDSEVSVKSSYSLEDGINYRTKLAACLSNFIGNGITSLTFQDGVDFSSVRDLTSFAEGCTELRSIDFGGVGFKVRTLTKAFKGCTSLSTLDLYGMSIDGDATEAFADSGLLSVYVSQDWQASGERLFKGAPLDNITII